jgi:ABC-type transport system involved in multi-copper enzyme maturation permease subunit
VLKQLLVHELRLIWREPRFWLPFLLPPLALLATQFWMLYETSRMGVALPADPRLLYTLGALLAVMGGTLSADSFAGERERNTLELLLSLPVAPRWVFLAKVLVILPVPIVFAWISQLLFWALFPGQPLHLLLNVMAFSVAVCLAVTGLSVLVSLGSQTVRAAGQMNALLVLVVLMLTQFAVPTLLTAPWIAPLFLVAAVLSFAGMTGLALRKFGRL